ncbi:hypothetical protein [Bradyrhizobium sp. P5_C11_2]
MTKTELLLFILANPESDFSSERVRTALKPSQDMSDAERTHHIDRHHDRARELTQVWTSSAAQSHIGIGGKIAEFLPDLHAARNPKQRHKLLQDMIDSDVYFLQPDYRGYGKTVDARLEPATGRLLIERALVDWQADRRAFATARLAVFRLLKGIQAQKEANRRALFGYYGATHHLRALDGKLMTLKAAKLLTACIVGADRQPAGKDPFSSNDRVMRAVMQVLEPRISAAVRRRQTKRDENRRRKRS